MSRRSVYLFGFVPRETRTPPASVAGLDGAPVRVLELDGFAAAVADVDAERYGGPALEARLKDLSWVARQGAAHEKVVTWYADHATILPARLFTIFSSEDVLRAEARGRAEEIAGRLERFRDLREWDLKVHYDAGTLVEHLAELSESARVAREELRAASPGRRYLLERKHEEESRREAGRVARREARALLDELRPLAEDAAELELPRRADELPVVLSAALLVRVDRAEGLRARAEERLGALERRGIHARLTGPWAPYRFVEREAAAHG